MFINKVKEFPKKFWKTKVFNFFGGCSIIDVFYRKSTTVADDKSEKPLYVEHNFQIPCTSFIDDKVRKTSLDGLHVKEQPH